MFKVKTISLLTIVAIVGASLFLPIAGRTRLAEAATFNYSGTNVGGPEWDRPIVTGPDISTLGPVRYSVQEILVDTAGAYDITSVQDYDGYLHVYQGSFDPLDQLVGVIAADDDGAGGIGTSEIFGVALTDGVCYYIVTSAFEAGEEGTFDNTVTGPGAIVDSCPVAPPPPPPPPPPPVVLPGLTVPNEGVIQISTAQAQPAYAEPGGEIVQDGGEVWLPADYDGNGFDTYTVTSVVLVDGKVWVSFFLGSQTFVWVPLSGVTPLTLLPDPVDLSSDGEK